MFDTQGHIGVMRLLLASGSDPNTVGPSGNTALRTAVTSQFADAVAALLESKADPNLETVRGTPLCAAASLGDGVLCSLLIDHGAKIDFETRSGTTALLSAVAQNKTDAVKVLLSRGADPRRVSSDGRTTPSSVAESKGHSESLALLMAKELQVGADEALKLSEDRQRAEKGKIEDQYNLGMEKVQEQMKELRKDAATKSSDLQRENDELRRRLGLIK